MSTMEPANKTVYIHPIWPFGREYLSHPFTRSISRFMRSNYPEDIPPNVVPLVRSKLEVAPGVVLVAHELGNHIFVHTDCIDGPVWDTFMPDRDRIPPESDGMPFHSESPISATILGKAYYGSPNGDKLNERSGSPSEFDSYPKGGRVVPGDTIPFAYLKIELTANNAETVIGEFRFHQPKSGVVQLENDRSPILQVKSDFFGLRREWTESLLTERRQVRLHWGGRSEYTHDGLAVLLQHLRSATHLADGPDALWERFFGHNEHLIEGYRNPGDHEKGVKALLKRKNIRPVIERLQSERPLDYKFFRWLFCAIVKDKKSNNQLLGAMLRSIGHDFDKMVQALQTARNEVAPTLESNLIFWGWGVEPWFKFRRSICLQLPGAKEEVEKQEAKVDWAKQKNRTQQADSLGIDKTKYPKLRKAVEKGQIPTSVFRQPDKDPVNREYPIWEKALRRKGWAEVIFDIATEAGRRSTYEKDITPYLSFLFRIEKYLRRHTKTSWKAFPKFIRSQWELEMEEGNETGTTKRRSAFTPVADNEEHTVTVPYVAVAVSGVRTQWCYARHYHVFEEGLTDPVSGGIVIRDLEPKLNGRDDYGLCFYTLTGTVTARGYPTFLIIFERLDRGTRVHFHRVRPQRSKNGRTTLACELVEACYQYMAGNIPAQDIEAQQGDLIFLRHSNNPIKAKAKVADPKEGRSLEFESHRFSPLGEGGTMKLYESEAKTPRNRLGFLWAPNGLSVHHPEHDDIPQLTEGWWEIRRCRSYENNPVSIWSLTID